jgi:hypothetical protein
MMRLSNTSHVVWRLAWICNAISTGYFIHGWSHWYEPFVAALFISAVMFSAFMDWIVIRRERRDLETLRSIVNRDMVESIVLVGRVGDSLLKGRPLQKQ